LTFQGDSYKIIDVGRTELCLLSVYLGNVRFILLAEAKDHDRIITKARDGRGPVSIWEISVQAYLDESVTIRALMLWVHGLMKAANEQIARWMDEQF